MSVSPKIPAWYSVDPRNGQQTQYVDATAALIEAGYQACVIDGVMNRQFVNIVISGLPFVIDVLAMLQYSSTGGTRECYRPALPSELEEVEEEQEVEIDDEKLAALPANAVWYREKKKTQVHFAAPEVEVLSVVVNQFQWDVALAMNLFKRLRVVGKRPDLHGKEHGFKKGLRTLARAGLQTQMKGHPASYVAPGQPIQGIASESELGMMGMVPTENTIRSLDRCVLNAMAEGWIDVVVTALPFLEDVNDTHDGAKGGFLLAAVEYRLPTEAMLAILKQPACIHDAADSKGMNILHWACRDGLVDLANRLSLEYGSTIPHDAPTTQGVTPLLFAACMGKIEIVELMCRFSDVNPHAKDTNGWSAIHYAAKYGFMPIIQFYYDNYGHSTDFWAPQQDGLTCLHFAVSEEQVEVVAFLLSLPECKKHINKGDLNKWTVMHYACKRSSIEILKKLLACEEVDCTVTEKEGCTPLMFAASSNTNPKAAKAEETNARGSQCVEELLKKDEVRALINEVDVAKWSALHYATRHGTKDVVEKILAAPNIDVNFAQESGCTALHFSVCHGQNDITHMILEHEGVRLDLPDSKGWTPLHYAAKSGNVELVRAFGKREDADLNIPDSAGCTALHRAAACEHLDVVEELLSFKDAEGKHRVDVTVKDSSKWTALHYAARYDGPEACVLLIDAGADLDSQAASDVTPVHYAACYGQAEQVRILLEAGADPNMVDTNGWNALHYAVAHGYTQVMRLLFPKTESSYLDAEFNKNLPEMKENQSRDRKASAKPTVVGPKGGSALPGGAVPASSDLIGTKRTPEEEEARTRTVRTLKTQKAKELQKGSAVEGHGTPGKIYITNFESAVKGTSMTILHYAVTNGEKEGGDKAINELLSYLDKETLVKLSNVKDSHGATAFLSACRKGYTKAVELLLECPEVDVGPEDRNVHALHAAVAENRLEVLEVLCKNPRIMPQIEARDTKGWTALLMASRYGHSEMIKHLLTVPGVNVNAYQIDYCTALHFSTCHGFPDVVKQLLAVPGIEKNCTDVDNVTPLLYALKGKTILTDPKMPEVVELLLDDPEVDKTVVDTTGWGVVHGIVRLGKIDLLEKLLNDPHTPHITTEEQEATSPNLKKKGININQLTYKRVAPLHGAVVGGQTDMVKYLLGLTQTDKNIKDIDGLTSLHYACEDGFTDLVELLLETPDVDKATFDRSGWSPFYSACKAGRTQVIKILLDHKARVLLSADLNESSALLRVAATVNLNQSNRAGVVPLHMACFYADIALIETLLYANTPEAHDIIKRGKKFYDPTKHKNVLWNHDIDLGATDRFGWNCFHYALSFLGPNSASTMTVGQQHSYVKQVCEVICQHPNFDLSLLLDAKSKPLKSLTHIIDAVEKPWPKKISKATWDEMEKTKKIEEERKAKEEAEKAEKDSADGDDSQKKADVAATDSATKETVASSEASPLPEQQVESVAVAGGATSANVVDPADVILTSDSPVSSPERPGEMIEEAKKEEETKQEATEEKEEPKDEVIEKKEESKETSGPSASVSGEKEETKPPAASDETKDKEKSGEEKKQGWEAQLVPKKTEPLQEEEFVEDKVDGDKDFIDVNATPHPDWRCRAGTPMDFAGWATFKFDFVPGLQ